MSNECYACGTDNNTVFYKLGAIYARCKECGSVYTRTNIAPLIQTDNDNPYERNALPKNVKRIETVERHFGRKLTQALDFGCGQGFLVNLLQSHEIFATGINYDTRHMLDWLPRDRYEAVFMVETIEHLENPKEVFEKLAITMVKDGIIYIETTFADNFNDPMLSEYVDPRIGHVNVLSKHGLEKVLPPSLKVKDWLNRNVVLVRKVE
jgi:hypothetical protein